SPLPTGGEGPGVRGLHSDKLPSPHRGRGAGGEGAAGVGIPSSLQHQGGTMKTNPELKAHARELRKGMTPAEKILWRALRDRRLCEYKFRRQQVFGKYVLDFYCANARLVLEIDGETHLGKEKSDEQRDTWLAERGIKV